MTVQLMMLPGDPGVPQLPVSLKTENGNSVNVSVASISRVASIS